ncbi:MAG: acyl-CoA dehydrogenase [Microthrixaceae bacterium]
MRFAPTEDQIEFAAAVASLLADTCTPAEVAASWGGEVGRHTGLGDGDGRVRGAWDALVEMGVLGLTVPEDRGGLGMDLGDLVPILTECGRAGLPDPVGDTVGVAAPLLGSCLEGEGSDLAAEWLGRISSGATVVTGFGEEPLVASATTADAVLLLGVDPVRSVGGGDPVPPERQWVRLLPSGQFGADAVDPVDSVDGSRALARAGAGAQGATELLGGAEAVAACGAAFERAAVVDAAVMLGLCDTMLSMTVEYVSERRQFGVPVGSFQAVKHHLADAGSAVAFAQPLVAQAAHLLAGGTSAIAGELDPPRTTQVAVSMAKARASQAAQLVSETALQCHGAIGYTVEADLQLFMKRVGVVALTRRRRLAPPACPGPPAGRVASRSCRSRVPGSC